MDFIVRNVANIFLHLQLTSTSGDIRTAADITARISVCGQKKNKNSRKELGTLGWISSGSRK